MAYIPFTEEEKQLANNVDLVSFLQMRGENLERIGREHKLIYYDSNGKHDSITIRGSTWFGHKNQVGGGAIKFMGEFYGMDFSEAVQELLGRSISPMSNSPPKPIQAVKNEEKKEFKLPTANKNMHRVYAYLIKQRFIAPEIITHFAKAKLLYEDAEHHNAVFVGVDEHGTPRQAHKRSTNSFGKAFRITWEGSDTKYSFAHFGKSAKLFVFEAAIDMLSFLTLNPQNWQEHSYIAMNGVYENAVLTALKGRSNLLEIVVCTDNDEGGIDAFHRLTDILNEKGYKNVARIEPKFKDWNEDLKAKNNVYALPAERHKRMDLYHLKVSEIRYFSCQYHRISSQIYNAHKNQQYQDLAEYALAGSVFFIGKSNENVMFEKLKIKLTRQYHAYLDKGKLCSKQDNLKNAMRSVLRGLKQTARTKEQSKQTAKALFELADYAVKCEVEQELSSPQIVQEQEIVMEETEGFQMLM